MSYADLWRELEREMLAIANIERRASDMEQEREARALAMRCRKHAEEAEREEAIAE